VRGIRERARWPRSGRLTADEARPLSQGSGTRASKSLTKINPDHLADVLGVGPRVLSHDVLIVWILVPTTHAHAARTRARSGCRNPGEVALVKAIAHVRDHGGHLAVDAVVEGDGFGRDAKRAAELHLERALGAAGLAPLLSREATVDGAHLVVKLLPGPARTLAAGTATIESHGAKVEVAIEVSGTRIFERTLDVAAPELVASRRDAAAESAARASLGGALDAATMALGLHAPAARVGGGK